MREPSVELPEVHAGIERRDLVRVAVERERRPTAELTDPPLGGLAPPWMIHLGIDVGVEPVLAGRRLVPGGLRLLAHEPDAHDRLRALEAVLPRNDDADRRPILVRQDAPVHAE